eukprot:gene7028-14297_t
MSKPKKFVISSFKSGAQMNGKSAEAVWQSLNSAIDEIYKKNASSLSFEELYRNAYNLIIFKHGDLLYNGVTETIRNHLLETASEVSLTPNDGLLDVLNRAWSDHMITMRMIKDVLMYMDRTYVVQHKKSSVQNLGSYLFRETIIYHTSVRERLRTILLDNIQLDRTGYVIDRDSMKNTLAMLVDLGVDCNKVYEEDFELQFLEATKSFYREESQAYLSAVTCPEYLLKAESRLHEESNRVTMYLSLSTEPKLKHIIETELITNHAKILIDMDVSGFLNMLQEDKIEDLKRIYRLFLRVPSTLDLLRDAMNEYIKKCGYNIIADQEKLKEPITFVKQLLDLKSKSDKIVNECFRSEKTCQKKLKDAFEDFLNRDTKCAAYLASYIDDLFKSGLKGLSEGDIDLQLDRAIVIFRFLQDKDIFENFYKIHLSKRLLSLRNISDDYERIMISKLKSECGYQFTSKLEGMFMDMHTSKNGSDDFHASSTCKAMDIELEVTVLTTGYWPIQALPPCVLPQQINTARDIFQSFYLTKNTGRKLNWLCHLGNVDIKAKFASGRKELNVSTYQMCILMLFNETTVLSLEQIRNSTQIIDSELRRHLLSLCTPKIRILKKSTKNKGIADDETFTFNEEFSSKYRRVKIPLISSSKEIGISDENNHAMPNTVEEDRRHMIEATIVRIMKARKTLSHNDLVAEVSRQLSFRFNPSPVLIKKRIESLLEREYLQRDKSDPRFYNYLA